MNEYSFYIIEDNIVIGRFAPIKEIDLSVAKRIIEERLRFFNERSYPLLIDFIGTKSIKFTKEARDHFASHDGVRDIKAVAFVLDSVMLHIIVKIFLTFNRPVLPAQIFTEKQKAMNWLKNFLKDEKQ